MWLDKPDWVLKLEANVRKGVSDFWCCLLENCGSTCLMCHRSWQFISGCWSSGVGMGRALGCQEVRSRRSGLVLVWWMLKTSGRQNVYLRTAPQFQDAWRAGGGQVCCQTKSLQCHRFHQPSLFKITFLLLCMNVCCLSHINIPWLKCTGLWLLETKDIFICCHIELWVFATSMLCGNIGRSQFFENQFIFMGTFCQNVF